jgi:hypothetical protein
MGVQIPVIAEKPLATCGCRKFQLDPLGDHLNTTGWLINLLTFFTQCTKLNHNRWLKVGVIISSVDPVNGHLRYPNILDQSLNDTAADKIRKYHDLYS